MFLHSGRTNLLLETRKNLFINPLDNRAAGGIFDVLQNLSFDRELLVRQFLVKRRHFRDLEQNILADPLSVTFAMPAQWIAALEKNGFKVNKVQTKILWMLRVLMMGCYGVFLALQEIWCSFGSDTTDRYQPHSFFVNLPNSAVPKIDPRRQNTILNWYDRHFGQTFTPNKVLHNAYTHKTDQLNNVSFKGVPRVLPILSFKQSISLFFWTLSIFARGFTDSLLGRWWTLFCISEFVLAKKVMILPAEKLAKIYFFSHEFCIHKPLWVSAAEQKGCQGIIYFYSTNSVGPKTKNGQRDYFFAFDYMNWKTYITWNAEHKKQLLLLSKDNQNTKPSNFFSAGSIDFCDGKKSDFNFLPNTIAVFDVAPFRLSRRALFNTSHELNSYENICRFLMDIDECSKQLGFKVVFKSKRSLSKLHDPRYPRLIDKLRSDGWLIIDPNVAPKHVLRNSVASIHFPFTSTGIIAKEMNDRSVYYDPSGEIACDDLANLGCDLISSKDQLMLFCRNATLTV